MEIGLLVFFDLFIKGSPEEIDFNLDPLEDLLKWENERYGSDHRKIGEAVLEYWHFPGHMVLCQHSSSDSLTSEDSNPLVRICQLASVLSRIVSSNSEGFNAPYQVAEKFVVESATYEITQVVESSTCRKSQVVERSSIF